MGGQLRHEDYQQWRRQWLRWHSRSLLANALALQRGERAARLDEMLKAYLSYGDFTENEMISFFGGSPTAFGNSLHTRMHQLVLGARRRESEPTGLD
ncbi:hypothetical protein CBM2598_U10045 [Cupriavidus taiwanensis]|uniref:Uncharacterized protein n=1 Tax=Cupriavidus taiwanensis TaxID=164546 RepID=A0A7Z7JF96_9BURK|nr:hypothetical protein CBM2597_U10304 [Cupriavidus taiwanensis]SOZ96224.1 hypothetical protein CBM2598_U10045 [Cupriavidus taiwanensis]SPC25507.1 hypothetical protein CBM2594_U10008 [Cupriavidus taiwanensis]